MLKTLLLLVEGTPTKSEGSLVALQLPSALEEDQSFTGAWVHPSSPQDPWRETVCFVAGHKVQTSLHLPLHLIKKANNNVCNDRLGRLRSPLLFNYAF